MTTPDASTPAFPADVVERLAADLGTTDGLTLIAEVARLAFAEAGGDNYVEAAFETRSGDGERWTVTVRREHGQTPHEARAAAEARAAELEAEVDKLSTAAGCPECSASAWTERAELRRDVDRLADRASRATRFDYAVDYLADFGDDDPATHVETVTVELRGADRDADDAWAVCWGPRVWDHLAAGWVHEPQPSSRDDLFVAATRTTLAAATTTASAMRGTTFKGGRLPAPSPAT